MKVICVFSGGLDSTVLLYKLIADGHDVVALSFDYGQQHKVELTYAKATTAKLGIPHRVFSLPFVQELSSDSSLLGGEGSVIVPCRNTLMITAGWALAESIGAKAVAVGAHGGDNADFPDCRPEFFKSLEDTLRLGSGKNISLWHPFTMLSKHDIVVYGRELGVDFNTTYTCYKGGVSPCGACASCVGRIKSLRSVT